jgi:uncharacterized SAM-binding protein YcdF (DUF218 family)
MSHPAHLLIRSLRVLLLLLLAAMAFTLFMYSPFYAKTALWLLTHLTEVRVDPIAAQSQNSGGLNLEMRYEPGSPEWVARQVYLAEVKHALSQGSSYDFGWLQQRYGLLQQRIKQQKIEQQQDQPAELTAASMDFFQQLLLNQNQPLFQQYRRFLTEKPSKKDHSHDLSHALQAQELALPIILQRAAHQPHAIVILGGGLTAGEQKGQIVLNAYTQNRLRSAIEIYHKFQLPILLSGVEAPYMQRWLLMHGVEAKFLENRSMNTCENTRFSALLLQKQGGAPTVFLVTDAYHMPRSRQLFAQNGIETIPVVAALPSPLTKWQPSQLNWMHSRRANYELLALLRSLWIGESNCREVP